jgi:F-type H+-transporting ATPase subunit b
LEALGLNLGYLIVQILMFGIVFVTLRKWAYGPMLAMLDKRRKTIAQGLEDAQVASEARANAEKEAANIISEAQAKSAEIIRAASEQAEIAGREIRAGIDAEAAKARESAAVELEQERNRILGELRGQVAALAIASTQKLIGETLDEKRQHALLDEFFSGVKSGKVIVLEKVGEMKGAGAEVTSALPLSVVEQETVKKDILGRLGGSSAVSFKVDPGILGGLVIKVGDRVMDGSVSGQLQNLRQSLN